MPRLSFLIALLAWISVFVLGFLAATHSIVVDGLSVSYWTFCFVIALFASGFSTLEGR